MKWCPLPWCWFIRFFQLDLRFIFNQWKWCFVQFPNGGGPRVLEGFTVPDKRERFQSLLIWTSGPYFPVFLTSVQYFGRTLQPAATKRAEIVEIEIISESWGQSEAEPTSKHSHRSLHVFAGYGHLWQTNWDGDNGDKQAQNINSTTTAANETL